MNSSTNGHERLLAAVLGQADQSHRRGAVEHLSDETLARFAANQLDEDERHRAIEILDACPHCREIASSLLKLSDDETIFPKPGTGNVFVREDRQINLARRWFAPYAIAATLLIALGSWYILAVGSTDEDRAYHRGLAMLRHGRFDEVARLVANSEQGGIRSSRLQNLNAEALRAIPAAVALEIAGRLTDFGHSFGGVVARDPSQVAYHEGIQQAEQILTAADQSELDVILNRGHLFLSSDRPTAALAEFQRATTVSPQNALGWLGLGLADFMLEDFPAAENAFRRALSVNQGGTAARINLAMTLEELGKPAEALAELHALLEQPLSTADRETIRRAIAELEQDPQTDGPPR